MNLGLAQIYNWAQRFSRVSVVVAIIVFAGLQLLNTELAISFQIVIAVLALVIGIPHGAIDHLVTLPSTPRARFVAYIVIYVLIAVIAGFGIATFNVIGFQIVVVMSALHFGFGDAAYINEKNDVTKSPRYSMMTESIYAVPAGFLPVMLPLTDSRALSALERINQPLVNWAGSNASLIRNITLGLAAFGFIWFLLKGIFQLAIDLALLTAISLIAPPLITFAIYFGCWHAIRHTARLVPKLPKSLQLANDGHTKDALRTTVISGLYAVVGSLALATALMIFMPNQFGSGLLWSTLVIVWALTVPHMMTTTRFDFRALTHYN